MNSTKNVIFHNIKQKICILRSFYVTRTLSIKTSDEPKAFSKRKKTKVSPEDKKTYKERIKEHFNNNPEVLAQLPHIPEKYLQLKRVTPPENLYLIDDNIAKDAIKYVLPEIEKNPDQIVCETNAGLGLITAALLEKNVKIVRMYEACPDFKEHLKKKFEKYEGRMELFTKDIFLLHRYEYMDRHDGGDRIEQFFKGVTALNWEDEPVMTVIGTLPNMNFIRFLIKSLVLQKFITSLGRIQWFTFMKPRDFIVLSAGPHLNLHTYQRISVMFNLFFDYELLQKYPRNMFLPWQSLKSQQQGRYPGQIDTDTLYFVKINFKKNLPIDPDNLLPFYTFVRHFFGNGTNKVVPTVEKLVPGAGINILIPKLDHRNYFKDMNIFTGFGELTPAEILAVFKELINYPDFARNHFIAMIESQMIKSETIETSLDDHITEKTLPNNINL